MFLLCPPPIHLSVLLSRTMIHHEGHSDLTRYLFFLASWTSYLKKYFEGTSFLANLAKNIHLAWKDEVIRFRCSNVSSKGHCDHKSTSHTLIMKKYTCLSHFRVQTGQVTFQRVETWRQKACSFSSQPSPLTCMLLDYWGTESAWRKSMQTWKEHQNSMQKDQKQFIGFKPMNLPLFSFFLNFLVDRVYAPQKSQFPN